MQNEEKLEEVAMIIIANSGSARSNSFAAIAEARKGHFEKVDELLKSAEESLKSAYQAHRELLAMDARKEIDKVSILLVHAQDHLMNSVLAKDLAQEMISLYQDLKKAKEVKM